MSSHLDHFADWMANHQFPDSTAQRHISNVAHFSQSLKGNVLEFQNFDRYVQAFLYRHLPKCKCKGWKQAREIRDISYSLNRFKNYLSDCHGIDLKPRNSVYASIHDEYLLWLSEIQKLENSTIRKQSGYLSQFLRWWKKSSNRKELRELTPYQVESFFIKVTHRRGKAYKQSLQGTLRSFFDFCDDRKYTQRNLRFSIPIIRTYRLSEVPRKIKDSEAVKLLGSIDRSTAGGIRTYAILQILYAYGVRGCQIRALKLKDVEWQKEEIHFPAVKGGKSCSFPLTNEVGNALLDYLGNVRKTSRHQEFFLTLKAPYTPLTRSETLYQIIATAMTKAGIESPSMGTHCFRHGFASRMLKQGESFKHIADLMGHKHIQTTFIYTKIDFDSLAEVALELPELEYEND